MAERKKAKENGRMIGIPGIKSPEEKCDDVNCPFHGKVGIRGRIFEGIVKSVKASNTAVIKWERTIFYPRYERFETRITMVHAHNAPCLRIKQGDKVLIGECRPLSKTKKFAIISKVGTNERT